MKLEITRQTVAQLRTVRVGEVIEVGEREARLLIAANKAKPADDAEVTAAAAAPVASDTGRRIANVVAASEAAAPAELQQPASMPPRAATKPSKKGK